jgi:hypothetical protein
MCVRKTSAGTNIPVNEHSLINVALQDSKKPTCEGALFVFILFIMEASEQLRYLVIFIYLL